MLISCTLHSLQGLADKIQPNAHAVHVKINFSNPGNGSTPKPDRLVFYFTLKLTWCK